MNPGFEADRALLAHMRDCLDRIREYTNAERSERPMGQCCHSNITQLDVRLLDK